MTEHITDARAPRDLHAFIAGLPKAELHVHHVGSASPRIVSTLAARHPDSKVPTDPEALADYFTFTDFAHFIEVYLSVVDLIRTPEDVRLLTYEIARDMARQQVRYAELTITPFSSTRRGIDELAFMEAIEDARKAAEAEFGTRPALVLRHSGRGRAGVRRGDGAARHRRASASRGPGVVRPRRARRSAYRGRSSSRTSTGRSRPVCTPCRTPVRPPARRRSGTRSPTCAPSASDTAPAPRGTRSCSPISPNTGSRWRSARPPTSPPARCAPSTSTPSGSSWTAGVLVTVNSDDPPMFGTDLNNEYARRRPAAGPRRAGSRRARQERGRGVVPRRARQGEAHGRDRHVHRDLARPLTAAQWAHADR